MATSSNPLVIQGTASFPPDEGKAPVAISFGANLNYKSILEARLDMVGAGSTSVPFGTVASPGAKAAIIEYDQTENAQAVQLRFNAGSDNFELTPGGILIWVNPNPAAGITALTIVRLADAVVRVRLFG